MPGQIQIRRQTAALRHRVQLDRRVQQPDGEGGFEDTWVPLEPPEAWAAIEPATVRNIERVTANVAVEAVATHLVTMDYHPQVTIQTRVSYRGRVLQIRAIANQEEADQVLVLVCSEVLPGGADTLSAGGTESGVQSHIGRPAGVSRVARESAP